MNERSPSPTAALAIPISDVGEARALFSSWEGRMEQFTSGRFKGNIELVLGGLVRIFRVEANQRIILRGHDTDDLISFYPVTSGCVPCLWQGRRLDFGQLVVKGSRAEVDHYSARGGGHAVSLAMRPADLQDAVRALLSEDEAVFSSGWTVHSLPPAAFLDLNRRFNDLVNSAIVDPSLLTTPEGNRFEQECVRALVASLYTVTIPRNRLSLPARTQLVRRAEELMRARLTDSFGAIDLCRELGVSDRTLRLAFRERYGVGPMVYYRYLRLNAVRTRLVADRNVAVAAAAREFGFYHMGNFASDYRRLFGMRPSETKRRSA